MTKQTWGLDWCLAFHSDTRGVMAACVYQIHRQKYDKGVIEHVKSFGLDTTVEPKGGCTVFVYSQTEYAAWFERATCWRGAPWLCHQTGRCIFFHFPLLMFMCLVWPNNHLAFSCISCASTQTQGVLLTCTKFIDTCFEHVKSLLNPKEVLPSSSRQRTSRMVERATCWRGAPWLCHQTGRPFFSIFHCWCSAIIAKEVDWCYLLRPLRQSVYQIQPTKVRQRRHIWESHMLGGAPWLCHWRVVAFFSIFHCWCSAIIAIFLFTMTNRPGDWIDVLHPSWQLACTKFIDKSTTKDTCIQQDWTCEIIWTWHDFILLNPKGGFTVFVYSADRGLAAWFERATCWRGAPWLCHQTGRCIFFHFPLLMFSNHSTRLFLFRTQRRFYRLRLLSRQRTSRMVWESHMLDWIDCLVACIPLLMFSNHLQSFCSVWPNRPGDWIDVLHSPAFLVLPLRHKGCYWQLACTKFIDKSTTEETHVLNMWNHLDLTRLHPVEPKGGFTVFVYSADRGLAAWFERATCWRGAPWLCHQTGRCIFFPFSTADVQQS